MASPFKVFRKHQKLMLALLCILVMFGFVLLPSIGKLVRLRGAARNTVVVETAKYGKLGEAEVRGLQQRRVKVVRFLERVGQVARINGGSGRAASALHRALGPEPTGEQAVVNSWLYAQHAAELGLVVSDHVVNEFIKELSENCIPWSQFTRKKRAEDGQSGILQQVGLSERQLFELLRQELLALQLQRMFNVSLYGTTPGQRWDYFTRLKRQAVVEVVPVSVAAYVGEVKDPSEKQLREFFEEYKDKDAQPDSPQPGFRRPQKIAIEYFRADYENFMGPDVVSEKEIRIHYEENRDLYDQVAESMEKTPPEEEKPVEQSKEQSKESTGASEEPAEEDAPAKEGEEEPDSPAPESNDADDTSSAEGVSPLILASLSQEEQEEPEETSEPKEPAAEPPQTAAEPQPPVVESEPPAAGPELSAAGPEESETSDDSANTTEEPEKKVEEPTAYPPGRTPEDVKTLLAGPVGDMIRRKLAGEKIDEIFGRLRESMNQYRSRWIRYEVDRDQGEEGRQPKRKRLQKPEPLDFKALAKANGLTAAATPLMSQLDFFESQEFGIGRSDVDRRSSVDRGVPFLRYAFETSQPYLTAMSWEYGENFLEQSRYLFWKVKETKPRPSKPQEGEDPSLWHGIPEFDDPGVREEVLRAHNMVEARKLALQAAEQLAEDARKGGNSLKEALPGQDVTVTEPFSWMTSGSVPAGISRTPPRLSKVAGVEMPGSEFMRTVFGLEKGGVGVAMNQPKTIAYVIRVVEVKPSQQVLWDVFERAPYYEYMNVARGDQFQIARAWREELESAAGLKWMRKADRPTRRQ